MYTVHCLAYDLHFGCTHFKPWTEHWGFLWFYSSWNRPPLLLSISLHMIILLPHLSLNNLCSWHSVNSQEYAYINCHSWTSFLKMFMFSSCLLVTSVWDFTNTLMLQYITQNTGIAFLSHISSLPNYLTWNYVKELFSFMLIR